MKTELVSLQTTNGQNFYITSNTNYFEYGNWIESNNKIYKCYRVNDDEITVYEPNKYGGYIDVMSAKKILLTTDQDLINDGVQPIDDKLLEWINNNQNVNPEDYYIGKTLKLKRRIPPNNNGMPLGKSETIKVDKFIDSERCRVAVGYKYGNEYALFNMAHVNSYLNHGFEIVDEMTNNTKEFDRGYNLAKKEIQNGENPIVLLNQARSSLTYDDFDKGWKKACNESLNTKEIKEPIINILNKYGCLYMASDYKEMLLELQKLLK